MGTYSKAITAGATVYLGLVLIKNGTAPKLVTTFSRGTNQLIRGVKGLTSAA